MPRGSPRTSLSWHPWRTPLAREPPEAIRWQRCLAPPTFNRWKQTL
jgi:hypothetical protein